MATRVSGELRNIWQLEDFGGKADGTTDNIAAWNAMFAAMGPTAGSLVTLGQGVYYFSGTPHVKRVCQIQGQGADYSNPLTLIRVPLGIDGIVFDYEADIAGTAQGTNILDVCVEAQFTPPKWAASTAYTVGTIIQPTWWGGQVWKCTTSGTSGTTQPAFTVRFDNLSDVTGDVVTDNGVVWTSQLAAGFRIHALIHMYRCSARYFAGDGFHVYASTSDSPVTAANDGSMTDCTASNNLGNGFHWQGADSNAWEVTNCYSVENQMWGFHDRSFLGNRFFGPNSATNGYDVWLPNAWNFAGWNGVPGLVFPSQYNTGFVYQASPAPDASHTTGATEPVWPLTLGGTVTDGALTWTAVAEAVGGSIQVVSADAYASIVGAYTEGGQAPMDLESATVVAGGIATIAKPVKALAITTNGSANISVEAYLPGIGSVVHNIGASNSLRLWGFDAYDATNTEVPASHFEMMYQPGGFTAGTYTLKNVDLATIPYILSTNASPYMPGGQIAFPSGWWWYGGEATLNTFGTAVPSSGTWRTGDYVANYQPTVGAPFGWRCLSGGTPGTWEALYSSVQAYGSALLPSGTTQTIDLSTGLKQKLSLASASGNVTVTLTNPANGADYTILITQGATTRNVVWPAAVKWPGGTAPTITAASGKVDKISLNYDGTNYYGSFVQNY